MQLFTFLKVFVLKIYDNNTITQNRDRTYYVLHKNCFYDKYCLFIFHIMFQLIIFQKMIDFWNSELLKTNHNKFHKPSFHTLGGWLRVFRHTLTFKKFYYFSMMMFYARAIVINTMHLTFLRKINTLFLSLLQSLLYPYHIIRIFPLHGILLSL